jgi:DNA (cytosine-5)-methyltransferase 1
LLENVKQLYTHDRGRTLKIILDKLQALGYFIHHKILNALDFDLPQKRERVIIVGFRENLEFNFPQPQKLSKTLEEILEPELEINPQLFASPDIVNKRQNRLKTKPFYPSIWHENKSGNISVLPFSCALRSSASYNYLLVNGQRRLSPREMLRLQGFPEDFQIVGSYGAMRKLTGNSVAVTVIEAVAKEMLLSINSTHLPEVILSSQ